MTRTDRIIAAAVIAATLSGCHGGQDQAQGAQPTSSPGTSYAGGGHAGGVVGIGGLVNRNDRNTTGNKTHRGLNFFGFRLSGFGMGGFGRSGGRHGG